MDRTVRCVARRSLAAGGWASFFFGSVAGRAVGLAAVSSSRSVTAAAEGSQGARPGLRLRPFGAAVASERTMRLFLPNKAFKPNLLRYGKSVAEKACHAFASTTQVGLTQALGCTPSSSHAKAYCHVSAPCRRLLHRFACFWRQLSQLGHAWRPAHRKCLSRNWTVLFGWGSCLAHPNGLSSSASLLCCLAGRRTLASHFNRIGWQPRTKLLRLPRHRLASHERCHWRCRASLFGMGCHLRLVRKSRKCSLTNRSSRRCFATRLNSSVRQQTETMENCR